jgi:hypothetical protein
MKTVKELRAALDGLDDDMEVILRITTDGGDTLHLMDIEDCSVEAGCTETEALMIDGYAEEDPEGDPQPVSRTT